MEYPPTCVFLTLFNNKTHFSLNSPYNKVVLVFKVLADSVYKLLGTTDECASFDLKDNDVGLNI